MTGDIEAIVETGSVAAFEIAASALAARGAKTGACANCAHPLLGAYCAVCGQPTKTRRRSVRGLLHDFVVDLINFDSRILRTARALLLQPGELPAAFRQGRTQPYVPSIRLYLFVSLVFFLLLSVTNIAILQIIVTATPQKVIHLNGKYYIPNPASGDADDDADMKKVIPPLLEIKKEKAERPGGVFTYTQQSHFFARIGAYHSNLTPAEAARLLDTPAIKIDGPGQKQADRVQSSIYGTLNKLAADPAALNGPLTDWIPRALFCLLPIYALVLALFHLRRRKDFYLVDHLVFSLSIHTFMFAVLIAAVGLAQVLAGGTVAWLTFIALSVYIFLAMKRFYGQGWLITSVKFFFISAIYCIFCLLPAFLAVLALSVFGGNPLG
ncbi:MAG: DUF3667 domain-containing protein [Rhizomicrobium sp.]